MTDELYNYIILLIVVLAYLHLWFHKFKYQKYEKMIETKINERFEDFITQKVKSMETLIDNYTDHLDKVTETNIYEIETTHEKFEKSSTKILTNITNIENEFSKLMNILRKAADIVKSQAELLQTKDDLITQKNNNIKRLESMIEQRNKKIKRLENEKNN